MGKRWTLNKERKELENEQESLRAAHGEWLAETQKYTKLYMEAISKGDEERAMMYQKLIVAANDQAIRFDLASKSGMDKIDKSSHVGLQDETVKNNFMNTLLTAGGIGLSTGLAVYGMSKAYDADVAGSLVNKGLLGFVKGMNPFTLLKKH